MVDSGTVVAKVRSIAFIRVVVVSVSGVELDDIPLSLDLIVYVYTRKTKRTAVVITILHLFYKPSGGNEEHPGFLDS
jgi:hypothetical protein